jgi:hypothetical protein
MMVDWMDDQRVALSAPRSVDLKVGLWVLWLAVSLAVSLAVLLVVLLVDL